MTTSASTQSIALSTPITGRDFVEAVRATAETYSKREVKVTVGESSKPGPRLSVTVEFKLGWTTSEMLYFHPSDTPMRGVPHFFDADGQSTHFTVATGPQPNVDAQHQAAIINRARLFVDTLRLKIVELDYVHSHL